MMLIAATIVASCTASSESSYDSVIAAHDLSFVVPPDSSDIIWQRARSWFLEQRRRGILRSPFPNEYTISSLVETTTQDRAWVSIERRQENEGIRVTVGYSIERQKRSRQTIDSYDSELRDGDAISESDVIELIRELAYVAHTGIDRAEFERRTVELGRRNR
jgi:hypothetical protein